MDTQDANDLGGNFIPASQRPDGTWRKPRRVKEGYVPQEEVPLYESKGKQSMNQKPLAVASTDSLKSGQQAHNTIPGLFILEDKNKKKKSEQKKKKESTAVEEVRKAVKEIKISEPAAPQPDPQKRLKNLKKRLREIEALEEKIKNGEIKNLEKDQLDKVARKKEVTNEIKSLEKIIPNS